MIKMIEAMRKEIEMIGESAERLRRLAQDNPGIQKNAEAILSFVYLLKFVTPVGVIDQLKDNQQN